MENMKPIIFISHIHENRELSGLIKELINKSFNNAFKIFVSSDEESIGLGDDWIKMIDEYLGKCHVILLLCNSKSITRPWIGYEAGAGWAMNKIVIPLCCNKFKINELPMPYSRWEAASNINRADSLNKLIRFLASSFDFSYNKSDCENLINDYVRKIQLAESNLKKHRLPARK